MRFFEDFLQSVGDSIELGSHQVTEASILEFARAYDPQPFHVDPEQARCSIYGGLIASGWHTAGIYMRMLVDQVLRDTASLGSPGIDELRWYLPVRPGDTLRGRITLLEARVSQSKPDQGLLRTRGELFNQDDQRVMSLVAVNFFRRRPS
jgi:acyl dehydratase